jgi:hypothetical protein
VTQRNSVPIQIAILGGAPVVGRALELALGSVGYDVRFLHRPLADEPAELLGGVELVLLGPRLRAGDREAFVNFVRSSPAKARIPVLELVTAPYGARAGQENGADPVTWPPARHRWVQARHQVGTRLQLRRALRHRRHHSRRRQGCGPHDAQRHPHRQRQGHPPRWQKVLGRLRLLVPSCGRKGRRAMGREGRSEPARATWSHPHARRVVGSQSYIDYPNFRELAF